MAASQDELMALLRAHIDGDHQRFRSLILMVAANAAKKSPKYAESLRRLSDTPPKTAEQFIALKPEMTSLLSMTHPATELKDMVLATETRAKIDRFLLEQTMRDKLAAHGLVPMRKVLFVGPPGVGKTMAASAIANAMSLPLMRVELSGVITSFLGATGANLHKVFQTIQQVRAVYLFDEFDALASSRVAEDLGEMRRVVNQLLQLIEVDRSESVIIGATNLRDTIDSAMFRRFDAHVDFPLPTPDITEALLRARLLWTDGLAWDEVQRAAAGIGHADLALACDRVNKDAVIGDRKHIHTTDLVEAVGMRRMTPDPVEPSSVRSEPATVPTVMPACVDAERRRAFRPQDDGRALSARLPQFVQASSLSIASWMRR